MWDGRFWVRRQFDLPRNEFPPPVARPVARPVATDLPSDRQGFGLGRVMVAAVVGVLLSHIHLIPTNVGSLEEALAELVVLSRLWTLFTYGSVVVILSLGRQGVDVLILRAMVVGFIMGATTLGLTPLLFLPLGLLMVVVGGLIGTVLGGVFFGVMATLANLLWYRSFRSLRPQLRIFNRGSSGQLGP